MLKPEFRERLAYMQLIPATPIFAPISISQVQNCLFATETCRTPTSCTLSK